ncbi:hypothetical protein KC318_g1496 [Hortaea werneckii]|uniref:Uncharacterized protein n=1 Tax=Hortaea werneckii TaxID=91943 RepID=A0A3M6XTA3_HORWE|nr:hypothetical protein KC334_g1147 [Hortaea werneckii]KAI6954819.1 hypothetical protein KC355_g13471 [Hortaea werneckii]KAI7674599.1 hypothetical protein KC318_g1496 [Hortaea werneckii]RMX94029.1 hypothetical protein D0867_13997 [Hortaea werneckii]RMY14278.1 hypothetical protein D0866_13958 [Hortaea werneckii]
MEHVLPYRIQEDCYTEAEEKDIAPYEAILKAVAESQLEPNAAAKQITDLLADHAAQEERKLANRGDDSSHIPINTDMLAVAIGSTASCFPPSHPAQERLLRMIPAFLSLGVQRKLPNPVLNRHGDLIPVYEGLEDLRNPERFLLLWKTLEPLHLEENFQEYAREPNPLPRLCRSAPPAQSKWSGVEKRRSEKQQRWRNFSHFCARLSVQGFADLRYACALFMLDPQRMISTSVPGWSGHLAGQALAAAQWIVPEGHGRWVWEQCRVQATPGAERYPGRNIWCLEQWGLWKAGFQRVVDRTEDERIDEEMRKVAMQAVKVMGELEI